jgi:ribose 5-phosphate isomerase A
MSAESMKQAAAVAAVARVRPDMVVGLGTGSTASCFVDALAERMKREGFRITGVPTSERTAAQAPQRNGHPGGPSPPGLGR